MPITEEEQKRINALFWKNSTKPVPTKTLKYKKTGICFPGDGRDWIKVVFVRKGVQNGFIPKDLVVDGDDGTEERVSVDDRKIVDEGIIEKT